MKNSMMAGLVAAVLLQLLVLAGMYAGAVMPLWTGTEIRVATVPVDPRSLFRGNYARLGYRFSRLEGQIYSGDRMLRSGEVVYVILQRGENGLYQSAGMSLECPQQGVFIRGRVESHYRNEGVDSIRINYGIEAFFAPRVKAMALEKELADGGVAVLMISDSGRAALREVLGQ